MDKPSREALEELVAGLRAAVRPPASEQETAERVAAALREGLPDPAAILTSEQRRGADDGYVQHVLHVESDGSFSVVALVWRPGQATPIHDHVSWCVVGVVQGAEEEVLYELDGERLVQTARHRNEPGTVCAFAPPGDVHAVHNGGDVNAISLHVYGADIGKLGSSIRRTYEHGMLRLG
jgi:predicted metal-dependent enzyme (double-stranded beta helix superfamily)